MDNIFIDAQERNYAWQICDKPEMCLTSLKNQSIPQIHIHVRTM